MGVKPEDIKMMSRKARKDRPALKLIAKSENALQKASKEVALFSHYFAVISNDSVDRHYYKRVPEVYGAA